MEKINIRIMRLLPVATNNTVATNEQHPKNGDIHIIFVEPFCSFWNREFANIHINIIFIIIQHLSSITKYPSSQYRYPYQYLLFNILYQYFQFSFFCWLIHSFLSPNFFFLEWPSLKKIPHTGDKASLDRCE